MTVPTKKAYVYLDHNATSPVKPQVRACMDAIFADAFNPSAIHSAGKKGRRLVSGARQTILSTIDALDAQLVFTSGGTESNNLVLHQGWDHILCSTTEHASVYNYPDMIKIPVLKTGLLDLEALEDTLQALKGKRVLISVHGANNETGILQPVSQIAALAHQYGAFCHTDAVQLLGKCALSFKDLGVDFLTLSAHKMGGPQGVGALVYRQDAPLSPILYGGPQENRMRPGTENVALICGFEAACQQIDLEHMAVLKKEMRAIEMNLKADCASKGHHFFVVGQDQKRLPQTSCLGFLGANAQSQLMYLDLNKIGVSIGSACGSGVVKQSHVLKNMGLSQDVTGAALRISAGWNTTREDLHLFREILTSSWQGQS